MSQQVSLTAYGDGERTEPCAWSRRRVEELCDDTLPTLAGQEDHDWPVRFDHCFRRICYDCAVGKPWSDVYRAPGIENLPPAAIRSAHGIALRIKHDGMPYLGRMNERSLWLRDSIERDELEYYHPEP